MAILSLSQSASLANSFFNPSIAISILNANEAATQTTLQRLCYVWCFVQVA